MQTMFDALAVYEPLLAALNFAKEPLKIRVFVSPDSLVRRSQDLNHVKHLIPKDEMWLMDVAPLKGGEYGIRVVFDEKRAASAFTKIKDRSLQIDFLSDVLKQIDTVRPDGSLNNIEKKLANERVKKGRFKLIVMKKEVSFPEMTQTVFPGQREFKLADKDVSQIADSIDVKPGLYTQDQARLTLNKLIEKLIVIIDSQVMQYSLVQGLPVLISKVDALTNEYDIKKYEVAESFDQEVDYVREAKTNEEHLKFIHNHKNYRYLIEKFVELQPSGKKELMVDDLKYLLALSDRILSLYAASDVIQYGIYAAEVEIGSDFLTNIRYQVDVESLEDEYGKEQAQIELGLAGKKNDAAEGTIPIEQYLDELDEAFRADFGFGLRSLVNVQQILTSWPAYHKKEKEKACYSATKGEIAEACAQNIRGYDVSETDKILDFLTLKSEELLKVKGESLPAKDLPVWEHNKRLYRYAIRPLVTIGEKYFWGAFSVHKTAVIWANIPMASRLPANIRAPKTWRVLKRGHEDREEALQKKIEEIAQRYSSFIRANVYPHKLDQSTADIGDCDALVFLNEKNVILNIESKIIDPPFSLKDTKRVREKIFGRAKMDGSFQKGYLQRVEQRENYLKENYHKIFAKLGWELPQGQPTVISAFVTQIGFWWTKFPPIETNVSFVEVRMLDDFIKNVPVDQ